ncbi:hypothetical protein VitviT2T_015949 [Vitis vinifera]|uniref:Uncharacterized protein n=1 Tax=Vitis vinifera TaxID=29760 RepID=A0ABY9CPA0_VITVI|nr:hypothetical protein VitviT2T_015949 [Vitis vinifera]
MGDFVGEQKAINSQLHQKIENVESSQIKRMDGMQNDLSQKIDNIQYSISRLTNLNTVNEKGKFPSQPSPNPKGVHEVETQDEESSKLREVKAVITLRSGKEVDQPLPKVRQDEEFMSRRTLVKESNNKEEKSGKKNASKSSIEEEPRIVIKEDMMKKHMPPPFPQALHGNKGIKNSSEILEVLRQVKVNIPLLDMIKQVPTYAKFLKDLCTVKRGLIVTKKAFLTEQVSAIIQCKSPVKYKDPGCPTISVDIGGTHVEKALLDLGESVNLLPYSVYKQLGLGGLKPTTITLSLADRSVKIPRGVIEDILVQVDKFYYPVDFVVLDTNPTIKEANYVPIILGRPFLATSNAIINCRNGVMQLTFGNMTLELNIFHLCKRHLHTNLFPLQHRVQRRGAILEALFLISEGYYFGPHHLIMASLLHFEEKVPKRHLMRADTILLLFPRLLCHVLAHMGFPADPHSETHCHCRESFSFDQWNQVLHHQHSPELPEPREVPPQPLPSIFAPSTSAPSEPVPEVASSDAPPAVPPTLEPPITIPGVEYRALLTSFQTLTTTSMAIMERMDHF